MARKNTSSMRSLMLLVLLTFALTLLAQEGWGAAPSSGANTSIARTSEKGIYSVAMDTAGKRFQVGVNGLNLVVRDKSGAAVTGAEILLTPWLPAQGHGVWQKPSVTDRGSGNYRVENIVFVTGGAWDLRVAIKQGATEDRIVLAVPVGQEAAGTTSDAAKPRGKYEKTIENYRVPNVTLLNQDGKPVPLRSYLDQGKPVVIDFVYTTCTTICPILSAGFTNLQRSLGADTRAVQLVSISIDPDRDRPDQMKEYLSRFKSGEGWDFLTGSKESIGQVLKAFDAAVPDKMAHSPVYILRGPRSDEWVRITGLVGAADLLRELRSIENK